MLEDQTSKKHTNYGILPPKFKTVCADPSKYVCWDGIHLTEAAYRAIAIGLLQGPYTIPQITTSCISQNATTNLPQLL